MNKNIENRNLKMLCCFLGGSHIYGLNSPQSDEDERGVFIHTEPDYILGLRTNSIRTLENKNKEVEDYKYVEYRQFADLIRKANPEMLETLFADSSIFTYMDDEFDSLFRINPTEFVDSTQLSIVLKGYAKGELKKALGETTGDLGDKRKALLETHGFSPKNFVQLLRLMYLGAEFFEKNIFPVNIKRYNSSYAEFLLDIKLNPSNYTAEQLTVLAEEAEERLDSAFNKRKFDYTLNYERLINNLKILYKRELKY